MIINSELREQAKTLWVAESTDWYTLSMHHHRLWSAYRWVCCCGLFTIARDVALVVMVLRLQPILGCWATHTPAQVWGALCFTRDTCCVMLQTCLSMCMCVCVSSMVSTLQRCIPNMCFMFARSTFSEIYMCHLGSFTRVLHGFQRWQMSHICVRAFFLGCAHQNQAAILLVVHVADSATFLYLVARKMPQWNSNQMSSTPNANNVQILCNCHCRKAIINDKPGWQCTAIKRIHKIWLQTCGCCLRLVCWNTYRLMCPRISILKPN